MNQNKLYCPIPNSIIKYGCKNSKYLLSLYLYSYAHQQIYNNNLVDVNIALLMDTFVPNRNGNGVLVDFRDTLKLMYGGMGVINDNLRSCIEYKYKMNDITTTSRLRYYFYLENNRSSHDFTQIELKEYNKIVDFCDEWNNSGIKKINTSDLINLYCYLKMKLTKCKNYCLVFSMVTKTGRVSKNNKDLYESMGIGEKTITRYLNILANDLKMISIIENKGQKTLQLCKI